MRIQFSIRQQFQKTLKTSYCYNNNDITKIKSYSINWIDYYKLQGYCFCNIDEMIIKTNSDNCNMTHKHYINQLMQMIERRLNFVFDRRLQVINALDCNKNHPLIRKFCHIRAISI